MTSEKVITEKTAWPADPIEGYNSTAGDWGYLIIYSSGDWEFTEIERPTDAEILKRWGRYFP